MVNLTINNRPVSVPEGTTIMRAAASIGINIPHLCYWKDLNEIAACRVCVVEMKGKNHLITACNNEVKEGMEIFTNSPKVRDIRKTNVKLILSQHDCRCAVCVRSGNCNLQTIANDLGCLTNPYEENIEHTPWNKSFPLIRDNAKCIKCMRCIQVCDKIQTLNVWDVVNTGSRTTVNVANGRKIENANCSVCGQCITHCPVGALRERDDIHKVLAALNNPEIITVVQVAPSIRTAWGEDLHMNPAAATEKRLAATLRHMGFDFVFDTNFAADLTIMEEANEFVEKFKAGELNQFPMFTSCCPGWVRFAKTQYPEIVTHLSTAKSPQQMFGAMVKSYFAQKMNIDPTKIFSVSIMPCTAKKAECDIPVMNSAGAGQDVDCVLTTRELGRLIRGEAIIPEAFPEEEFDSPLGTYSGAGVIFGSTGGVMEAALRTAYCMVAGENPPADAFEAVRGMKPWKEATYNINGAEIRTAVVHGLGNARQLIQALKRREVSYHFVEVMACPGGCVGGGGQPIHDGFDYAELRAPILYDLDKKAAKRFSHENPEIHAIYRDFLETPGSELAEELLHTDHEAWNV
ncbi:MAG: [FeFe] hydrogenase, group A [Lachnospiraceae bacterium]